MRWRALAGLGLVAVACSGIVIPTTPGPVFDRPKPPTQGRARLYVFLTGHAERTVQRKVVVDGAWAGTLLIKTDRTTGKTFCEFLELEVDPGRVRVKYFEFGWQSVSDSALRRYLDTEGRIDSNRDFRVLRTSFTTRPATVSYVMINVDLRYTGTKEKIERVEASAALPKIRGCHRSAQVE